LLIGKKQATRSNAQVVDTFACTRLERISLSGSSFFMDGSVMNAGIVDNHLLPVSRCPS